MSLISHDAGGGLPDNRQGVPSCMVADAGGFGAADVLARARHPFTAALAARDSHHRRAAPPPGAIPCTVAAQMAAHPRPAVFAPACADIAPVCTQRGPPVRAMPATGARGDCFDGRGRSRASAAALSRSPGRQAATADTMIEAQDVHEDLLHLKAGLFRPGREIPALDGVSLSVAPRRDRSPCVESGSGKSPWRASCSELVGTLRRNGAAAGPAILGADAGPGRLVQPIFQDPYSSLNPRRTAGRNHCAAELLRGEDRASQMSRHAT